MSVCSGTTLATFGWLVSGTSWTVGFALLALPALAAAAILRRVPEPAQAYAGAGSRTKPAISSASRSG